jgi:protein phosphatase
MILSVYGRSIQGSRDYQEDYFEICTEDVDAPSNCLLVLCDGMGGHSGGATASQVATTIFSNTFQNSKETKPGKALTDGLAAAHLALQHEINKNGAPPDMGTTIVAVYVNDTSLHWISVGDSHLYLYRDGKITKLNADHSMAAILDELAEIGRITREEAIADPQRNALRSCLSADDIALTETKSKTGFLKRGDKLILASDGLDTIDLGAMEKIVRHFKRKSAETIVAKLLAAVEKANKVNQDNTTIAIISTETNWWFF